MAESEQQFRATEMEDETHDAVVWSWRKESGHPHNMRVGQGTHSSGGQVS